MGSGQIKIFCNTRAVMISTYIAMCKKMITWPGSDRSSMPNFYFPASFLWWSTYRLGEAMKGFLLKRSISPATFQMFLFTSWTDSLDWPRSQWRVVHSRTHTITSWELESRMELFLFYRPFRSNPFSLHIDKRNFERGVAGAGREILQVIPAPWHYPIKNPRRKNVRIRAISWTHLRFQRRCATTSW